MSATRALIEFLKDREDKIYNLKTDLEYPSFNGTKIVSIGLDEHNAIVVGLETNGNFTTDFANEMLAFDIMYHLSMNEGKYVEIPSYPMEKYEDFNIQIFKDCIKNFIYEVSQLESLVDGEVPLDNEVWKKIAVASSMYMNDIQNYNRYVEERFS